MSEKRQKRGEIFGGVKKKSNFELRSKVLSLEKTQKKFGFLLVYSYLCTRFRRKALRKQV